MEFFKQTAPIPAINFAGRGYVTPNLSVDAEIAFFRIPSNIEATNRRRRQLQRFRHPRNLQHQQIVGAQLGWRKTTIFYEADLDCGDLKFSGFYFGGVVQGIDSRQSTVDRVKSAVDSRQSREIGVARETHPASCRSACSPRARPSPRATPVPSARRFTGATGTVISPSPAATSPPCGKAMPHPDGNMIGSRLT